MNEEPELSEEAFEALKLVSVAIVDVLQEYEVPPAMCRAALMMTFVASYKVTNQEPMDAKEDIQALFAYFLKVFDKI